MSAPDMSESQHRLFADKCGDVTQYHKSITIPKETMLMDAIDVLSTHNITSAPVVVTSPSGGPDKIIGVFDCRRIAYEIIRRTDAYSAEHPKRSDGTVALPHDKDPSLGLQAFIEADVQQCGPISDKLYAVFPEAPLLDALRVFADGNSVTSRERSPHRVHVIDPRTHALVGLISQSDMVRYIAQRSDKFTAVNKRLMDFYRKQNRKRPGGGRISVNGCVATGSGKMLQLIQGVEWRIVLDHYTVLQVLRILLKERLFAVAVLDQNGVLTYTFSMSDLKRAVLMPRYSDLMQTVRQFKSEFCEPMTMPVIPDSGDSEQQSDNSKTAQFASTRDPVVKSPSELDTSSLCVYLQTATVLDVIRIMTAARVHQVWVVDRRCKLLGVVTQPSLLQTLYPFFRFVSDVQSLEAEQARTAAELREQQERQERRGSFDAECDDVAGDGQVTADDGEVKMICRRCHQLFVPSGDEEKVNVGSGSGGSGSGTNHDQACAYHPGHATAFHSSVDPSRMVKMASTLMPSDSDIWSCCNGTRASPGCRVGHHVV